MIIKPRYHGRLLRLNQVHKGKIINKEDQKIYILNKEQIPRVRVYGIIVDRYDSPSDGEHVFSSLLLDDGSETIYLKLWRQKAFDENINISDVPYLLDGINVGQIVDVLGIVREYEGEKFIIPVSIIGNLSIDWEIYRRAKLLENDFEKKGMGDEQLPIATELDGEKEVKMNSLLSMMSDIPEENTIDLLANRLNLTVAEVMDIIKYLQIEGIVISPRPGIYTKLSEN